MGTATELSPLFMKIAILSQKPRIYSTQRLKQACEQRGHDARILAPLDFSLLLQEGKPDLRYRNKRLGAFDGVILRVGPSLTFFGAAIVRQFEQMGVYCLNSSLGITTARDKLCSMQLLSRQKIGIPYSAFISRSSPALPVIEDIGGAPVVIKLLGGSQGIGVILAETDKMAEAVIQTLHSTQQNVLIQKFIAESKGRDMRAFVVGGKVVAAMRRIAQGDEYRSNIHCGGQAEKISLNPEYEKLAIHATQIIGLNVAGVDILESNDGPKILEVNASPGLEGIEAATGVDVASEIVKFLEENILIPQLTSH